MQFGKMYSITYCQSPTWFIRTHDHHQAVLKNTNKTFNELLICIGVTTCVKVNILGTPGYNTVLVYILTKNIKFNYFETGKTGCVCVV